MPTAVALQSSALLLRVASLSLPAGPNGDVAPGATLVQHAVENNEAASNRLRRHASHILEDAVFLEVADLFLYAFIKQVDLRIVLNTTETLAISCVGEYLEGLVPSTAGLPVASSPASKWTVVLTRADFRATLNIAEMNHYLPCWASASVPTWEEKERV